MRARHVVLPSFMSLFRPPHFWQIVLLLFDPRLSWPSVHHFSVPPIRGSGVLLCA